MFLFLLAIAGTARAASSSKWIEVKSPHFVVVTDAGENQGRKVALQFEGMRALFESLIPHANDAAPITILALHDGDSLRSIEPAAYLGKGKAELGGLFLPTQDRNYILVRTDVDNGHPYSVVYHEYTHFILRHARWMPLWLNEGLAQYYENTEIGSGEFRFGQPDVNQLRYLNNSARIPLPILLAVTHGSSYYHDEDKTSAFYCESWALTHMLFTNDYKEQTNRMQTYFNLLAHRQDPVSAAAQAFGDLSLLQRDLERYVAQNSFMAMREKSNFSVDPKSFSARPLTPSDADAFRAEVLANNDRADEAIALSDSILKSDPRNALAHEVRGSLAFRNRDLAQARKWYDEAVQLNPDSQSAQFHFATLALMAGDRDNPAVEASLRQCIHLDPNFAAAYDALGQYFAMGNRNLDEAHLLTIKAVELEPGVLTYRLSAAQVLAQQNNFAAALSVLHEAQKHATTPEEAEQVRSRIDLLTQHQQMVERYSAPPATGSGSTPSSELSSVDVHTPEPEARVYPTAGASAPHHTARGILRNIKCSYPAVLTFSLEDSGKQVPLFAPNYFKVPFSTSGYVEESTVDPCSSIAGMKARVEYAEVKDKELTGQVLTIELSK